MKIKGFHYFGTGAGLPSLVRNVSSMAVDFENEWFLFDCGEGTQQRVMASPLKMTRLTHIFISHFHGDHLYGLPGLLATMQLQGVTHPLTLIGPKGLKEYIDFNYKISGSRYKRQMTYIEIDPSPEHREIYKTEHYTVETARLRHRVPCYGYRLKMEDLPGKFDVEKANLLGVPNNDLRRKLVQGETVTLENGRVISPEQVVSEKRSNSDFTYITDTSVCPNIDLLSKDSVYLHHECTFMDDEEALAEKSGHCTLGQVLTIAEKAQIKQLHLAHFSPRYDSFMLRNELKEKSFKVFLTRDTMEIEARF